MGKYAKKVIALSFLMTFAYSAVSAQSSLNQFLKPADTLNKARRNMVLITEAVLFTTGVLQIGSSSAKGYKSSNFHFVDDTNSFLLMDKGAHVFSSYQFSSYAAEGLKWSGMSKKQSLLYGAGAGYLFLTTIEFMDGFVCGRGTSPSDIIANTVGSGVYVSQELMWDEQRIIPKFSSSSHDFVSYNSRKMKSEIVREFNDQTYWLSVNLRSFAKDTKIPRWLNIAVGHGVEGVACVKNGDLPPPNAYHQYFLSLDADLTKIKTKSHVLKTIFYVVNYLKVPAPTFEIDSSGRAKFHPIYF